MRVSNEFVEKKEVKKTRPRLKQADFSKVEASEYLQFVDFEQISHYIIYTNIHSFFHRFMENEFL